MNEPRIIQLMAISLVASAGLLISSAYADVTGELEIEIKYTSGDRLDTYQAKYLVYQDDDHTPILEKNLENNPDTLVLPQGHDYTVEVYVNGIFAETSSVKLIDDYEKLEIGIPGSGGLKFNVFYADGETPVDNALVVIKSQDGQEQRIGTTNEDGESMRYWLQSTNRENDFYVVDFYFEEFFLTSVSNVKIHQNKAQDQKIVIPMPAVIEDLITLKLFNLHSQKIIPNDGNYSVILLDRNGHEFKGTQMNHRGELFMSNIPSGAYSIIVLQGEDEIFWTQEVITITGENYEFDIYQMKQDILPESSPEEIESEDIPLEVEEEISSQPLPPFVEPIIYEPSIKEYTLSCNCVSFRLDDIQNYWLSDVQIELLSLFSDHDVPLMVGIIANEFGEDPKILQSVKNELDKGSIKVANHGFDHVPFSNYDKQEQNSMIVKSTQKIEELLNITPTTFIPPQNKFNEDTIEVLTENSYSHMSAALYTDSPPFLLENKSFYRFPQTAETGGYIPSQNRILGIPAEQVLVNVKDGINQHGYSVITLHPQEFAVYEGGEYINKLHQEQFRELENLIELIQNENIPVVFLDEIQLNMFKIQISEDETTSDPYFIPKWIKNNAGWWRDGLIDDSTFVQGIQFLVNENILNLPPTYQGDGGSEIPIWVKNNAGWWAENRVSDEDFINGVNYLINQGIITIQI